jgi:HlyD family secretion protein
MLRAPEIGRTLTLLKLAPSGSLVKQGDLIVEIDSQGMRDHLDGVYSDVIQAEGDIRKRRAEQAIEMENLRQNLRVAQADLAKARLDHGAAEIRTEIDVELLKLAVEESDARFKQVQNEVKITEAKHASEIKILEFTLDRHHRHRDRHLADLEKTKMYSPMAGLVVMSTVFRQGDMGQIQEGDQVFPGQPFMKIVDTSKMLVEGSVNQADSERLRLGQAAMVTFDAFPGLRLPGKVESIGAMAAGGRWQNYFVRNVPVRVAIDGRDPRVIPDLSAGADIVLEQKDDVLMLPREAVREQGGKSFVTVRAGQGYERKPVQPGLKNDTQVEVLAGLDAGAEVLIERAGEPDLVASAK